MLTLNRCLPVESEQRVWLWQGERAWLLLIDKTCVSHETFTSVFSLAGTVMSEPFKHHQRDALFNDLSLPSVVSFRLHQYCPQYATQPGSETCIEGCIGRVILA